MMPLRVRFAHTECGLLTCEFLHPIRLYSMLICMPFPHSLPQCGHVFCGACLENWFSTTLVEHLVTYPTYDPNPTVPDHLAGLYVQACQEPNHPYIHLQLKAELVHFRIMQNLPPPPVYTCPLCRKPVENGPVEDFALKSIVETLAHLMGESPPRTNQSHGRTHWEGFFGGLL
jgi:hypothetical protein